MNKKIYSNIIRNINSLLITIEEIISIDKSGRTYYNTSINYRNTEISYKKNSYISLIKYDNYFK
jgi:hypothetical protein